MSTSHGDEPVTSAPADQSLVEALASPVFIVQHQRFAYVNPAFARLMGVERAALTGQDSLESVHPDDRKLMESNHARALAEADVIAYVARRLEPLLDPRSRNTRPAFSVP